MTPPPRLAPRAGARLLLAALVAVLLAAIPAAPARAAEGFEFSADGTTWGEASPAALFPGSFDLVPGDAMSTALWVRNASPTAAVLSVVVTEVEYDSAEAGAGFGLAGRDEDGAGMPRTALADIAACAALVPARTLDPGEELEITVEVDLGSYVSGNQAQGAGIAFSLALGLVDPGVELRPHGCPADPIDIPFTPPGGDPDGAERPRVALTGSDLAARALLAALATGGAGWLLLLLSRRRRRSEAR